MRSMFRMGSSQAGLTTLAHAPVSGSISSSVHGFPSSWHSTALQKPSSEQS
jgi:hypothetical protein